MSHIGRREDMLDNESGWSDAQTDEKMDGLMDGQTDYYRAST